MTKRPDNDEVRYYVDNVDAPIFLLRVVGWPGSDNYEAHTFAHPERGWVSTPERGAIADNFDPVSREYARDLAAKVGTKLPED